MNPTSPKSKCSVQDCTSDTRVKGWCGKHYQAWRRHGDPAVSVRVRVDPGATCSVQGCDKPIFSTTLCSAHYTRQRRYGDTSIVKRGPEVPVPETKPCAVCGEVKSLSEFTTGMKASKGGKASYCRPCAARRQREWRIANPERTREHRKRHNESRKPGRPELRMKQMYGISPDQYEQIREKQGGGCGICGGPRNGPGKRFHIDHDHNCCAGVGSCGKCIRGLLCGNCNTLLGLAKESPDRLRSAIAYLEKGVLVI